MNMVHVGATVPINNKAINQKRPQYDGGIRTN